MKRWVALLCCLFSAAAFAQAGKDKKDNKLAPVTVSGISSPVEKSYRKMVSGMDLFERMHSLAPAAQLRFKLLPRKPGTNMDDITLEVVGDSFAYRVPIAPDRTFTIGRDPKAIAEDAAVIPNKRKLSMTWRSDIRSPGVPPGMRRLGDMRLECLVGMQSGLVSNTNPIMAKISSLLDDPFRYCGKKNARYLFFADRPVFAVTLVAGERREVLPIDSLYASASDDPGLKDDMPYCDCEVMLDRTYFLPLGDTSWPDDTLVQFEYMEDRE